MPLHPAPLFSGRMGQMTALSGRMGKAGSGGICVSFHRVVRLGRIGQINAGFRVRARSIGRHWAKALQKAFLRVGQKHLPYLPYPPQDKARH